ncbi:MerR HTH family regulatory protein [Rhodoblastus acidophilus]|uniref:MerR HTH family regulatory protein n=1 Tax=Rhodoblastus acidophilus TaxID=1074 RepID=A0A212S7U1_RHOAC|nr:MerR family transcriptional regulator [Rhodoblastus acidophilus]PPQ37055.1 hypothetical protein CKO16_15805 [Rhodoblastus acidophilus]RAI20362.1 hypothetical protein CH337_10200 [Rhodoblastus acidophilus]SNB81375.1 MerR HTH family regulatory protein [Rhodoblastus acidophilus]
MEKTTEAFRTIGEVADELDLPQHVLRFWETKFSQIRPVKRAGGRRYYRPEDIALVAAIRVLLYSEGYTIKGVQRILKEQGVRAVMAASGGARGVAPIRSEPEAPAPLPARMAPVVLSSAPAAPRSVVLALAAPAPTSVVTCLSAQDRHRLEAILAELTECSRLLA